MAFRAFRPTHLRQMAAKMTEAERSEALREANAKMREYHMKRPPIEKVRRKKRKSEDHTIQMAIAASFATVFLATPFLGQKIAKDEEWRSKYIPNWYDFTLEKPANPWTRKELHEQLVLLQQELHERAIAGEFTPEKLDEMRRHFAGVDPKDDPHGWGKLHPGIDDDEDIEDDD